MYVCSYFCKALFGVQCTSFLLCITNPQSKWWRVGLFIKIYANCTLYFTLALQRVTCPCVCVNVCVCVCVQMCVGVR